MQANTCLLILTALMVTLIHGYVEVRDRYHSYVIPLLMPVAAFAIATIVNRRAHRSSDTRLADSVEP